MLTAPSPDFTAAANADYREPKLKVEVLWTDPFVQSGVVVSTSNVNNFCDLDSMVVDDLLLHVVDTRLATPHKYIINDGSWINDGTFYPVPGTVEDAANNQVGWYTSEVSDVNGDFDPEAPGWLTVEFASERTIKQLILVGEPTIGQYPTNFDVLIYDEDDNVLNSATNFSANSVETVLDFTSDNILTAKYMKLTLNSWSAPNTVGKIVEFFGVITDTFYSDDIVSMDVLEEMEADEEDTPFGSMSINELTIEFQNISIQKDSDNIPDPFLPENSASYLNNSITKNVRLTPYIGFKEVDVSDQPVEYVQMGVFWATEWEVAESEFSARVVARDRLELLRLNTFRADEILENATLKDVAEYVFNHAKVNIPMNDLQWEVNSDLENYTVNYVWLGKVTYFEAIKKIASACMGRAYCDRYGKIIIETFASDQTSGSHDVSIGAVDYFNQSRKMQSVKNHVSVPVCPLEPEADASDIYESDSITMVGLSGTIKVESVAWGDDVVLDHEVVITEEVGIEVIVISSTFYAWGATIVFFKTYGLFGTFKYKVTGKRVVAIDGNDDSVAIDEDSIRLLNKQEHRASENYLIQTQEMAGIIADAMLAALLDTWRNVECEIQGNPCTEIGDIANIEVYSKMSAYSEFRIIRQQFKADSQGVRCMITGKKTIDFGS
jgi:hypothetical protein